MTQWLDGRVVATLCESFKEMVTLVFEIVQDHETRKLEVEINND